jgi:regulator of replication initiation timing
MIDKVQQLETQVSQVNADLASLKTETNEAIKKTKLEEVAAKVKSTKEAITNEIETLK